MAERFKKYGIAEFTIPFVCQYLRGGQATHAEFRTSTLAGSRLLIPCFSKLNLRSKAMKTSK